MKNRILYILFVIPALLIVACQETYELDSEPPKAEDASFTYEPTEENDNIIVFNASPSTSIKNWDLGNGQKGKGETITGTFPTKGTYTVTLTIYAAGGSVSSSQEIVIEETDPTLLDKPLYNKLTGGADNPDGKTWVIDSARSGHFGLGPHPSGAAGDVPEWYAAGANEKAGGGMYDDRYTFRLAEFGFEMQNHGDVYINGGQTDNFPGSVEVAGDFKAPFTPSDNLTWNIAEPEDGYPELTISSDGFIGYFTGVRTYQIVRIEENELFLRYLDAVNDGFAWYLRLIPEGYDPGGGDDGGDEPTDDVTLPLDFETFEPPFEVFGGSSYAYVDNPDKSGINTSDRVLQTEHGGETWAGIFTDLAEPLDLSQTTKISLKVWAPQTGTFRFKLENPDDNTDFIEVDQFVDAASQWVELTFDISGAIDRPLSRLVIFPGWDVANAGTFYVDDIRLNVGLPLTFENAEPAFEVFGGSTYSYVDNPDQSGINTSGRVLQTEHGGETWAGLFTDLTSTLDLSSSTTLSLKVWAPQTGTFRLKMENINNSDDFIEIDQTVDAASEWVEISFDISGAVDQPYRRLVLFPGWNVANAGTFYIDDIQLAE